MTNHNIELNENGDKIIFLFKKYSLLQTDEGYLIEHKNYKCTKPHLWYILEGADFYINKGFKTIQSAKAYAEKVYIKELKSIIKESTAELKLLLKE